MRGTATPSTGRTSTGYYTSGGRGYYAGGRPYGYYYGGGAYGRGHTVMIVGMYGYATRTLTFTLIPTLPLTPTLTLTLTLPLTPRYGYGCYSCRRRTCRSCASCSSRRLGLGLG